MYVTMAVTVWKYSSVYITSNVSLDLYLRNNINSLAYSIIPPNVSEDVITSSHTKY